MRDTIVELLALQKLDQQIDQLQQEYDKLPNLLEERMQELNASSEQVETLKQEKFETAKERDRLNLELQEEQERIRQYERRTKDVGSQREHQALMRELGFAKRVASEAESEVLKRMEAIDQMDESITEAQSEAEEIEKSVGEIRAEMESRSVELKAELDGMLEQRRSKTKGMMARMIGHYDMVRRRHNEALCPAANYRCTGCNMSLPPQLFNQLLRMDQFITCPSCQRILYVETSDDA